MGCWDVFCVACGCSCYSMRKDYFDDILELYKEYEKNPSKSGYYKNIFDAIKKYPNFFVDYKKLLKTTNWINNCCFLTADDKVIKNVKEVSCNIDFKDPKGNIYHQYNYYYDTYFATKTNNGVFIHNDCLKFIKKNYKIDIKFSDLPLFIEKKVYNKINKLIDYGPIEKYWEQDFNYIKCTLNKNQYMCENPLTNLKNATRIKKIISHLKLNTDPKRAGPSVSATFYPTNTIKFGLNKKIWIKKNGKWMEIKEPIETIEINTNNNKSKLNDYLNNIMYITEPTTKPIFIQSLQSNVKNNYKIKIIGTKTFIEKLKKMSEK